MRTIDEMVAQAIGDPGSMTPRIDGETTIQWSTRAVMEILQVVIGVDQDANYPRTPAARALAENAALRERVMSLFDYLRVANNLLHEANGIICNAENLKLTLRCLSSHCAEGDHVLDLDNPVPIGPQDWRDAAKRWATRWHEFMDSDRIPSDQEAGQ